MALKISVPDLDKTVAGSSIYLIKKVFKKWLVNKKKKNFIKKPSNNF